MRLLVGLRVVIWVVVLGYKVLYRWYMLYNRLLDDDAKFDFLINIRGHVELCRKDVMFLCNYGKRMGIDVVGV